MLWPRSQDIRPRASNGSAKVQQVPVMCWPNMVGLGQNIGHALAGAAAPVSCALAKCHRAWAKCRSCFGQVFLIVWPNWSVHMLLYKFYLARNMMYVTSPEAEFSVESESVGYFWIW